MVEIWGGMECTVNRVGNGYFDQLKATAHDVRDDDLGRFAAIGIRKLRYPLLWERVAPTAACGPQWDWCDRRMSQLRNLGMQPVVGLMHHGSGPLHTSLADPSFPGYFERYATAVARRFPWTPFWILINEPLTTARFSCLYGHWYPHERDNGVFARAIIGQCLAIARASNAIRAVNPEARLIQSEDLGRAFSTPLLSYQAALENERRWLTFDLLCGRVRRGHVMWDWLRRAGADLNHLAWLADHPVPPDLLGINHYLTSERFLDERVERYPPQRRGGNERHRYADVEAVRVCAEGPAGLQTLLQEAWDRYHIPIVITEAHLDCSREEQLRWVTEVRQICEDLSQDNIPVLALTVWSLLGSFNWNELASIAGDYYESGVFDIRGGTRRETRLAQLVRSWTSGDSFDHPVLDGSGWWRRSVRLLYPPVPRGTTLPIHTRPVPRRRRHIVVVGATLAVQREFYRASELRDLPMLFVSKEEVRKGNPFNLVTDDTWAIVLAGLIAEIREVFACPDQFDIAMIAQLARAGADAACHVTLLSSHQVFGSTRIRPYSETDAPEPRSDFGRLTVSAERVLATIEPQVLIARAAACLTDRGGIGGADIDIREAFPAELASDAACSWTYLPDLVRTILDLAIDGERGTWHLANRDAATLAEIASMIGAGSRLRKTEQPTASHMPMPYLLVSGRAPLLPGLGNALERAGYGSSSTAPSSTSASR